MRKFEVLKRRKSSWHEVHTALLELNSAGHVVKHIYFYDDGKVFSSLAEFPYSTPNHTGFEVLSVNLDAQKFDMMFNMYRR